MTQESESVTAILADSADLSVIAPANANVIGKIAQSPEMTVPRPWWWQPKRRFDRSGAEHSHV